MNTMSNTKHVTITLPKEQLTSTKQFSKETGRTFSGLVSYALNKIVRKENEQD